jgi:hypothetical protein
MLTGYIPVSTPVTTPTADDATPSQCDGTLNFGSNSANKAYIANTAPNATEGQHDAPVVKNQMPKAVPMHTAIIIRPSRRATAHLAGPAANCQTLVTNEGITSNAAACTGAITRPNAPMATVGKPMPTMPLTYPAERKTIAIKRSDSKLGMCHYALFNLHTMQHYHGV